MKKEQTTTKSELEAALLESENRYKEIVGHTRDIIFTLSAQRLFLKLNPAFESATNWTAENWIGRPFIDLLHPKDIILANEHFSSLLNVHYAEGVELRIQKKTGEYISYEILASLQVEKDGTQSLLGIAHDITKRKDAEEKVLKANRVYSVISQINQAIIHIKNKDELFQKVCRIAVEVGNFPMAWVGIVNASTNCIEPVAFAGNEDGYLTSISKISILDEPTGHGPSGTAVREKVHVICNDIENDPRMAIWKAEAHKRCFRSSIALPIKVSGNIIGAFTLYANTPFFFDKKEIALLDEVIDEIGFALEVYETEAQRIQAEAALRKSEEKYRTIIDSTADFVFLKDEHFDHIIANKSYCAFNHMTEAGILGKNDFELMPGIYATICRLTDQEAITSNKLVVSEETWDNQTFESVKFPVEYDKGKIGVGGYIRDISERKRIQEELIRLNAELEHRVLDRTAELQATNKELESFSYSVSHDLRAPLRAIDGLTKILLEKYESTFNDEEKQLCGLLQDNAHKMERLIDDLLRFSRTNRTKLKIASIDMKELVQSVYNELTSNEKNRRIEFQLGDLHPVSGDKMLIRQVWVNLISNAIKFSSHREQSVITISSNIEDNKTVYCITDNGAGFNMRYIDKLFGVFQRLHTTREFEGTGVGLAIAHNIVKRHNGKIWAAAEVDKGATFKFSLPI